MALARSSPNALALSSSSLALAISASLAFFRSSSRRASFPAASRSRAAESIGLAAPNIPLLSEPDSEGAVEEGVGGTERAARLSLRRSRGAGGA